MAKGNLFLGQARGKVGSVVFARAFGEQITRTRPTSVANPKTIGQNTQRAILATIAKEAALLTPIVDHAFASVAYGAESVRHFRKVNMGLLRNMVLLSAGVNYNLSAKGANAVPNALKISEGNLPAFSSSYQSDAIGFYMSNTPLGVILECDVENFKASYPYIQGGDQLTLVKIVKTGGSLVDGDATFALKVDRVVFAPDAFDDPARLVLLDDGLLNNNLLDLTKTTNPDCIYGVNAGAGNAIGCATDDDDTYAAALILSRKVNNTWQRSTQYLELTEFDDMTDNQAAIESYGASASLAEETEYLNQSDEYTPAAGIESAYGQFSVLVNGTDVLNASLNAGESNNDTVEVPASTNFALKVNGFGTSANRIVTCEVADPSNVVIAHGAKSARWGANWKATLAGAYKLTVLFSDGTRSEFTVTLSQHE